MHVQRVTAHDIAVAIEAGRKGPGPARRRDVPVVEGLIPGFPRALLKLKPTTLSELWGYQLAQHLGVRVPRCAGFWIAEDVRVERPEPEQQMLAGDFGLLVEELSDWVECGGGGQDWDGAPRAAAYDPEMTGRAMALRAFDGGERSIFGIAQGDLYLVDLEGVLIRYDVAFYLYDALGLPRPDAPQAPELTAEEHTHKARASLRRASRYYAECEDRQVAAACQDAKRLDVVEPMMGALRGLRDLAEERRPLLELTGHPRARPLRLSAERALRRRIPRALHHAIVESLLRDLKL
jgi:hypothetical protein